GWDHTGCPASRAATAVRWSFLNPTTAWLSFLTQRLRKDNHPEVVPRIGRVIDRDQVLHVARLARLRLSEREVETMVGELSGILEHVDRIGQLDLEGVEPTSHVVALENVWREDEPVPSLPREAALANAPDPQDGAFRAPSPQAE
ncbi:MAG: Asp-tRNA(Asn)/Glu-tRNA(Gln) amidotransferase subunit GatC, partial [Solirubrobacterales bacterium]